MTRSGLRRPRSGGAVPRTHHQPIAATAVHDPSRIDILRRSRPASDTSPLPYVRPGKQRTLPSILALNEALGPRHIARES